MSSWYRTHLGAEVLARPWGLAVVVALAYLACALPQLDDHGPSWDYVRGDYPHGERLVEYLLTGDEVFLDLRSTEPAPPVRQPHLDLDVGRFHPAQIFPVAALLSGASCRLFWTELGILPPMVAHNLPAPLLAAVLVLVVTAWGTRRWGALAGVVAGGSLALNPNFFGHSCHNLKDVAECCFYTGAVLAGFNALDPDRAPGSRRRWWAAAGAATALAMAQKPNALFLPVQLVVFLLGARLLLPRAASRPRLDWSGLALGAVAFVLVHYLVSPPYWTAPLEAPGLAIATMLDMGSRTPELGRSVQTSLEVVRVVLISTPPVTLVLAALGAFRRGMDPLERWFVLLGVGLPIARNFVPGMRHFGGTRHFLEFLPMLALLAGCGAARLADRWKLRPRGAPLARALRPAALAALALVPCGAQVWATHPHQTVYLNALVGGHGGAVERGLDDVGDLWAKSYWQGLRWLSENAEPGAEVMVPVGAHVARAAAPVRLRPDLRVLADGEWGEPPFYAMYVLRTQRGFVGTLDRELRPVHEIRVQGGAILRIHRLEPGATTERLREAFVAWGAGRRARQRIVRHLLDSGELAQVVDVLRASASAEEATARLREVLPPSLHADLQPAVELYMGSQARVRGRGAAKPPQGSADPSVASPARQPPPRAR